MQLLLLEFSNIWPSASCHAKSCQARLLLWASVGRCHTLSKLVLIEPIHGSPVVHFTSINYGKWTNEICGTPGTLSQTRRLFLGTLTSSLFGRITKMSCGVIDIFFLSEALIAMTAWLRVISDGSRMVFSYVRIVRAHLQNWHTCYYFLRLLLRRNHHWA